MVLNYIEPDHSVSNFFLKRFDTYNCLKENRKKKKVKIVINIFCFFYLVIIKCFYLRVFYIIKKQNMIIFVLFLLPSIFNVI